MNAMIENWNRITGADYTEEDFKWDLHNGEKSAVFFQRGWDASESEAKKRLAEIVGQYDSASACDHGADIIPNDQREGPPTKTSNNTKK